MSKVQKYLLTISIPTYNRRAILGVSLKRWINEIESNNLTSLVEIVISDNCSTDGTEELVKQVKLQAKTQIRYSKNSTNLGVIKNILKLVELTEGKFWMFYGDDDLIPENSLVEIVNVLADNDYPVFMFQQFGQSISAFKPIQNDKILSVQDLALKYFYYVGNAGVFAIDSALAKQAMAFQGKKLYNTCWPQTEILFISAFLSNNPMVYASVVKSAYNDFETLTYSNSYYQFETQLFSLLRSALSINETINNGFLALARQSIFGIEFFTEFKVSLLEEYLLIDLQAEKTQFERTITVALNTIPKELSFEIVSIKKMIRRPRFINLARLYFFYVKGVNKKKIDSKLVNRIKILSPFGYVAMLREKRERKRLLYISKGKAITENSGYF